MRLTKEEKIKALQRQLRKLKKELDELNEEIGYIESHISIKEWDVREIKEKIKKLKQ